MVHQSTSAENALAIYAAPPTLAGGEIDDSLAGLASGDTLFPRQEARTMNQAYVEAVVPVSHFCHRRSDPVTATFPRRSPGRMVFAYIICINNYKAKSVPPLRACVNDGKKFARFLQSKFPEQVLQIKPLLDDGATYDRILSLFESVSFDTSIQKGDLVIFFYAGHGTRTKAPTGWQAEDGSLEMLCPHDIDTSKDGKNIHGIPDFVVGTLLGRLADARGANVLLVFDSCHSAGMARDDTEFSTSISRYTVTNPVPESVLNQLFLKYPEGGALLLRGNGSSVTPFTLLAACGKHETAREYLEGDGAFTDALIEQLNRLPWHNLSYATLCKSLRKLPYQTPECIGKGDRVIFTLQRAQDEGLYFDIEPNRDGTYTVKAAGLHLGVGVGTKFKIRAPGVQDPGILVVQGVGASHCHARMEILESRQGSNIPRGAKAFLYHWCLGGGPLRVALGPGIQRPNTVGSAQMTSEVAADVVVAKSGDNFELVRRKDSFISRTTGVYTLQLPKNTDSAALGNILERVARFHHHLLRPGPGDVITSIVMELCQVVNGTDGRSRMHSEGPESGTRVMRDRFNLLFRPNAEYGVLIKNKSNHILYPYLFYFDPSGYSIHSMYPPSGHRSSPLAPDRELQIGFGSSLSRPLDFYLMPGEDYDVGYIRLFVSTFPLPLEIIKQPPITESGRHCNEDAEIADSNVWDVRTIVMRQDRNNPAGDIFTRSV